MKNGGMSELHILEVRNAFRRKEVHSRSVENAFQRREWYFGISEIRFGIFIVHYDLFLLLNKGNSGCNYWKSANFA
jgi:hypothetical protein